nr:nucleotidyl transferase AbiEii/AbiGii toxin family protein [uncultured Bradyrhizobium sp.]
MAFQDAYRQQVALLIRTIPFVAQEQYFALKGGTAINLFVRDLPRLSVDIDLTYLPVEDRASSLAAIDAAMMRIRAEDEQKRQTWRFAAMGLAAGILLWSILPGTVARAVPESWNWPERMARKAVGEPSIVEAGIRLIRSQNPEAWEELAEAQGILSANREALELCKERVRNSKGSIRCTVVLKP